MQQVAVVALQRAVEDGLALGQRHRCPVERRAVGVGDVAPGRRRGLRRRAVPVGIRTETVVDGRLRQRVLVADGDHFFDGLSWRKSFLRNEASVDDDTFAVLACWTFRDVSSK